MRVRVRAVVLGYCLGDGGLAITTIAIIAATYLIPALLLGGYMFVVTEVMYKHPVKRTSRERFDDVAFSLKYSAAVGLMWPLIAIWYLRGNG